MRLKQDRIQSNEQQVLIARLNTIKYSYKKTPFQYPEFDGVIQMHLENAVVRRRLRRVRAGRLVVVRAADVSAGGTRVRHERVRARPVRSVNVRVEQTQQTTHILLLELAH